MKKLFQKSIARQAMMLMFDTGLHNNFSNNMYKVRNSETDWLA